MLKIATVNIVGGYTEFKLNEINIEFRMINKRITAQTTNTSTDTTGQTGGGWYSGGSDNPATIAGSSSD